MKPRSFAAGSLLATAICMAFLPTVALAQAQPAPTKMQSVMGSGVLQYIKNRGFAANDPRAYQTMIGVSKVLASKGTAVAGGVIAGAAVVGTSPGWGSILLASALTLGVGYAIDVAVDGTIKWVFNPSSTPVTTQTPSSVTLFLAKTNQPSGYSCTNTNNIQDQCTKVGEATKRFSACLDNSNPVNPTRACTTGQATTFEDAIRISGYQSVPPPPVTTAPQTMEQAAGSFSTAQLAKQLAPAAVAVMVNAALQEAAQDPEYAGLPYSESSKVTAEQIAANPDYNYYAPTVGDLTVPVSQPATGFSPAADFSGPSAGSTGSSPTTVTPTAPATAPGSVPTASPNATEVNLGADPGIGAPILEPTPTPSMILDPLLNMMPSLRSYAVPQHTGTCPRPTFEILGNQIVMESHCTIIEPNRQVIHSMMLAVFGLASVFIVLRA